MRERIIQAFKEVRHGFSPDRVVADPELDATFLNECRALGLTESDAELNRCLLNARKGGYLKGLTRSRPTSFPDETEYRFASEVAIRYLERKYDCSLDDVVCTLQWATEFDAIAESIAPGFSPLQYRWAALNLRKRKLLQPENVVRVVQAEAVELGRIDELNLNDVPRQQGVYVFYGPEQTLYVGEASNLRRRIGKHLEHSDNKGLARWLWEHGSHDVYLELHALPESTQTRARRAYEAELIQTRHPVFNVARR